MADPKLDIMYSATGASPVAAGGTITFQYLPGRAFVNYAGQGPARMNVRASQANYVQEVDFKIAFNASNIVVTYTGTVPIAANTPVGLELPLRDMSGVPEIYGQVVPEYLQPVSP